MIMYSLHPMQNFQPIGIPWSEALECIQAMANEGVTLYASDFISPTGEHIVLFWSVDGAGVVATVWEYTFDALSFPASVPVSVRQVQASVNALHEAAQAARKGEAEDYAVGE